LATKKKILQNNELNWIKLKNCEFLEDDSSLLVCGFGTIRKYFWTEWTLEIGEHLCNVWYCLPVNDVSYLRRAASQLVLLWEPQISQQLYTHISTSDYMLQYIYIYIYIYIYSDFNSPIHLFIYSIIFHSVICLTIHPQPLPKQVLHIVWSSASSFNF